MTTIDAQTLSGLVICALERTAMVLAESAISEKEASPATRFARICYEGPCRGSLILGADDHFLRELASGLMGIDASEVSAEVEGSDALKELANIVGGSVIVAASEGKCEASLGLPELIAPGPLSPALSEMPAPSCLVTTDTGVLYVWLEEVPVRSAAA